MNYREYIIYNDSKHWKKAMDEEYNSLMQNSMWILARKPTNVNIIGSKWVYTLKEGIENVKGKKFKEILIAQAYTQV